MRKSKAQPHFVVCTRNEDCDDLAVRKIYEAVPDESAAAKGFLRVIDDSGEDYLYPIDHFVAIELSRDVEKALRLAS